MQLVGWFSFLIRKLPVLEDNITSDHGKLDIEPNFMTSYPQE